MERVVDKITIGFVYHEQQRYPTVGDWYYGPKDDLVIRVSRMSDQRYQILVAVHELIEVILCNHQGITQHQVDDFDMQFEKERRMGDEREPGECKEAPYHRAHQFATKIEKQLAKELEVNWRAYEEEVNLL